MSWNSGPGTPPEMDQPKNVRFEIEVAGTDAFTDEQREAVVEFFTEKVEEFAPLWKSAAMARLGHDAFTPEERTALRDGILRLMDQDPDEYKPEPHQRTLLGHPKSDNPERTHVEQEGTEK